MTMVVTEPRLSLILSIDAYTSISFFLSKALVASSSKRIYGCFIKALAMAILYFWPPESYPPAVPTFVSKAVCPIFSWIKSQALADLRALITSSSVASGFP